MNILAGDIGGTNTRLRFATVINDEVSLIAEKQYASQAYPGLDDVIRLFISEFNLSMPLDSVCMAVAGPVKSSKASVTNLPWEISVEDLRKSLSCDKVCLINDFVAIAHGISQLTSDDVLVIKAGTKSEAHNDNQDAAVVGAGTGLGAAHLLWKDDHYEPLPGEAGHTTFAPTTPLLSRLLSWLQQDLSHVSLEMLLSGRGFLTIYNFIHKKEGIPESREVKQKLKTNDPAKVITDYALNDQDQLCVATLNCFIDIYGAALSDIVLHYYPLKTVYIAGGIAVKIKDELLSHRFIKAFENKGLMTDNMKELAVKLIVNESVGLNGAQLYAAKICY